MNSVDMSYLCRALSNTADPTSTSPQNWLRLSVGLRVQAPSNIIELLAKCAPLYVANSFVSHQITSTRTRQWWAMAHCAEPLAPTMSC